MLVNNPRRPSDRALRGTKIHPGQNFKDKIKITKKNLNPTLIS
jgi:hypothetical protein